MRTLAASFVAALLLGLVWFADEPAAQSPTPPTATSAPPANPTATAPTDPVATSPSTPQAAQPQRERFDKVVREDMFAGFRGDEARMIKALATCDAALKEKPDHAEALVWRGAARMFQAGQLLNKGSILPGMKLWSASLEDMDKAVQLEPNNPGVRIPRAAVLLPAARNSPKRMSGPLLDRALDDYATMTRLQADKLDQLGDHPWGELRMGLADVYRLRGDLANSKKQLDLVLAERPETEYANRAKEWLAAPETAKLSHSCIGCHGN